MKYENEQNFITRLIKSALSDTTPFIPNEDLNWDVVFHYGKIHRILPLLYFGIKKLPNDYIQTIPNVKKCELEYKENLVLDANRENEISKVSKSLSENDVDFMLLKGSITKHFYPDTSMRTMSDIDILYRNADIKTIDSIFERLNYKKIKSTLKDCMFANETTGVQIEMQTLLIDEVYSDWFSYLDNIWDKCSKNSSGLYEMSKEDFYIYHIIHMAKHFINGGIGLRHVIDTWIINNHYKDIDYSYIDSAFDQLGLSTFNSRIKELCNYWFDDKTARTYTIKLAKYILNNGAFGNVKQQILIEASGNDGRVNYKNKVFPPKAVFIDYFGDTIKNHPCTIPFYWLKLTYIRLFKNKKSFDNRIKLMNEVSKEQINEAKEILDILELKKTAN